MLGDRFETAARSRLAIYEEESDYRIGENILRLIRHYRDYARFFHDQTLKTKTIEFHNPDQIFVFDGRVVIAEMKSYLSLGKRARIQLAAHPHVVSAFIRELNDNPSLRKQVGLDNRILTYNPLDPNSNWLVFNETDEAIQRMNDSIGLGSCISFRHQPHPSCPFSEFEGLSSYLPVGVRYDNISAHRPMFYTQENLEL